MFQSNVDQDILELVWNNTNDAIFTIGYDGRIISANPAFTSILGWEKEDLNYNDFPFFVDISKEEHQKQLELFRDGKDVPYYVTKRKRKDGMVLDILASYRAINNKKVLAVGMYKDFTEQMGIQKRLEASEGCYRNLVEFIPDAIFVEQDGEIIFVNQSAANIVGAATPEQLIGYPICRLVKEGESSRFLKQVKESASKNKEFIEELCRLDGTPFWGEIVAMRINFNEGEVLQVLVRDVTVKKNYEAQLEFLAFHDPLTGLSNRRYFFEYLNDAIEEANNNEKMFAILYLDIDKFKNINDSLGHDIGDQLLKQFANRLKENVREKDVLCRIGGDEFLILLDNIKGFREVEDIVTRLHNALKDSYRIDNRKIGATPSIGISIFPSDGTNSKTLILHADQALYQAKVERNSFHFYKE